MRATPALAVLVATVVRVGTMRTGVRGPSPRRAIAVKRSVSSVAAGHGSDTLPPTILLLVVRCNFLVVRVPVVRLHVQLMIVYLLVL